MACEIDNFEEIKAINRLFEHFYPYIAAQMVKELSGKLRCALEIGPYSVGISLELMKSHPDAAFVVGDDSLDTTLYLRGLADAKGRATAIKLVVFDKYRLPFKDRSFELISFRGGLFFWEEQEKILKEMHRVTAAGGVAYAGGGFGEGAPDEIIERHAAEIRELNRRLGKIVLQGPDLEVLIEKAGLVGLAQVQRGHGLWIVLRG